MGDFISRSAVIDVLKQTGIIQDNDLGHLVVDEINRIPTAYDVDAVVAELKERCIPINGDFMNYTECAVEIVRKGGAE